MSNIRCVFTDRSNKKKVGHYLTKNKQKNQSIHSSNYRRDNYS